MGDDCASGEDSLSLFVRCHQGPSSRLRAVDQVVCSRDHLSLSPERLLRRASVAAQPGAASTATALAGAAAGETMGRCASLSPERLLRRTASPAQAGAAFLGRHDYLKQQNTKTDQIVERTADRFQMPLAHVQGTALTALYTIRFYIWTIQDNDLFCFVQMCRAWGTSLGLLIKWVRISTKCLALSIQLVTTKRQWMRI